MLDWMQVTERLARRALNVLGVRSRFVTTSAGPVHVLEARGRGALPPLVLVHGFSASAATQFVPLLPLLTPHFSRVIALDLPGHGESALAAGAEPTEVLPAALGEVLSGVAAEPAVVFATSLGGAIALRCASTSPGLFAKLVLCSPAGAPFRAGEEEALLAAFAMPRRRDAFAFVDRLFAAPAPVRLALALGVRTSFRRPVLVRVLRSALRGDPISAAELAALPMPVLLVWGARERVLPASGLAYFKAHLPATARVVEPPSFGHAPFLDHPGALAKLIVAFARGEEVTVGRGGLA